MKQVAVFKISEPEEVAAANKLLSQLPPENVGFTNEMIVINFDDQTYPNGYKIEELRGLILSNERGLLTTDISIKVGLLDLERIRQELNTAGTVLADIKSTTLPKDASYDIKTDRKTKIEAYENNYKALEQQATATTAAIATLQKTIHTFNSKNLVLSEAITSLS